MSAEDRIRAAFDDVRRRAAETARTATPPRPAPTAPGTRPAPTAPGTPPAPTRRAVPALAAAAVVVVLIGGIALFDLVPGTVDPASTTEAVLPPPEAGPAPTASTTSTTSTDSTAPDTVTTDPRAQRPRYRVDTEAVRSDADDPFLNVRVDPDPSSDIVRKLPATYTGIAPTGFEIETEAGGVWWEVDLEHPVTLDDAYATPIRGWVNSAFLVEMTDGIPVGSDELEPCAGDGEFGTAAGSSDGVVVTSIDWARLGPDCTRYVVTFADDAGPIRDPASWALISDRPLTIGLRGIETVTAGGGGLFVVRDWDGSLDLVSNGAEAIVRTIPARGLMVVDVERVPEAPSETLVVDRPLESSSMVTFTGLARPFEATLGVSVETPGGDPVEATFVGTIRGTERSERVGVMTTDWSAAWGRFAFEVEGLEPGSYVLSIVTDGGSDEPRQHRVPFAIERLAGVDTPSDAALEIATAMRSAAWSGPAEAPVFADEVLFGLVEGDQGVRSAGELEAGDAWVLDVDGYRARAGTVDILQLLTRPARVTEGTIDHCAAPPATVPPSLSRLDRINLEPIGATSCIDWFAVSIFLDGDGAVAAVLLDLWEP